MCTLTASFLLLLPSRRWCLAILPMVQSPIAPIGTPEKVIAAHSHLRQDVLTSRDVQAIALPRRADAHKGDFGHVLVIGGSVGKSGAAAMAGLAALRVGAGLVTVASPKISTASGRRLCAGIDD